MTTTTKAYTIINPSTGATIGINCDEEHIGDAAWEVAQARGWTEVEWHESDKVPEYTVRSCNFSFHEPIVCATYTEALAAAKARGFQARVELAGELVATWCPLYGTHVYNRTLAH